MKVTVTQEHWDKANKLAGTEPGTPIPAYCSRCALAVAAEEALGEKVSVGFVGISVIDPVEGRFKGKYRIDRVGQDLIHAYDHNPENKGKWAVSLPLEVELTELQPNERVL